MLRTFLNRLLFQKQRPLLQPGERAPDFELSDQEGRTVRARDLAGRRWILWFYPKADTPG